MESRDGISPMGPIPLFSQSDLWTYSTQQTEPEQVISSLYTLTRPRARSYNWTQRSSPPSTAKASPKTLKQLGHSTQLHSIPLQRSLSPLSPETRVSSLSTRLFLYV